MYVIERLRTADGVPMALERSHIPAHLAPDLLTESLVERSLYDLLASYGLVLDRGEQVIEAGIADSDDAGLLGLAARQRGAAAAAALLGRRRSRSSTRCPPTAPTGTSCARRSTSRPPREPGGAAMSAPGSSGSRRARCSSGSTARAAAVGARGRGRARRCRPVRRQPSIGRRRGAHRGELLRADGDALLAVDEEGGDVTRLHYTTGSPTPGNYVLGAADDVAATRAVAAAIGARAARVRYSF